MGLFNTTHIHKHNNVTRHSTNINLDKLEKPLQNIGDSISSLAETQIDRFVEIGGNNLRTSLIDSVSEIKDNKFTVIYKDKPIEYCGDSSLDTRTVFNRVAIAFGINLSLPVCKCGVTTENLSEMYIHRFNGYDLPKKFESYCSDCRKLIQLEAGLFRHDYDVNTDTNSIIYLDDQIKSLNLINEDDMLMLKRYKGKL